MTNPITLFSVALLVSLAASCSADQLKGQLQAVGPAPAAPSPKHSLLGVKLMGQPKARSARSLSDMFERVKSRIFGSKKQAAAASSPASSTTSQLQPAASANSPTVQRQPWDLNSFNQQFNPYATLSNGVYQWPSGSSVVGNQFLTGQQSYGSLMGLGQQAGSLMPGLDGMSAVASQQSGVVGSNSNQQQPQQQQMQSGANQANGQSSGGLFSSASHLIAQYLSPSSAASGSSAPNGQQASNSMAQVSGLGQQAQQQNGQQQSGLTPQQQQAQSQYQEFASILDSMVAQTGNSNVQRQPAGMNQYMPAQGQQQQQPSQGMQQQQQGGPNYANQQMSGAMPANGAAGPVGADNEMASSSNIQSYMPVATPQQASAKSSMVGLAEQLAPGAQFNKLISFPFSLSTNDDQTKEGRYKLHIPFLNQHLKRSDQQQQQQQVASANEQLAVQQRLKSQQMQQYLSSLYQQQYAPAQYGQAVGQPQSQQQQSQQLSAQASQVVPTIVSPQSSASSSAAVPSSASSGASVSSQASQSAPASSSVSQSSSAVQSSASVSSPVSSASASAVPSVSSSSSSSSISSSSSSSSVSNQRPSWSVADTQASVVPSSSKLIPIQSAVAAASDEAAGQN